jgi:Flp pilus assembly protein TadD/SAM-dependent methyltransferase
VRHGGESAVIADAFRAAIQHHQSGRLPEAEALYRKILARDPSHIGSLHYLGVIAHQVGRSDQAAELIGRAIALNPSIAECHYHMGLVLAALGRLEPAETHFRKAIGLKPDYADAHMDLGNALKHRGKLDDASACYRRALQLRPDSPQIHYNLANLLAEQGKLAEAVNAYERALALAPRNAAVHNNLGSALLALGELDGALAHFEEALRHSPDQPETAKNIRRVLNLVKEAVEREESVEAKIFFVRCVRHLRTVPADVDLRPALIRALSEPWAEPNELMSAVIAVIRNDPIVRGCIDRAAAAWPRRLPGAELFGDTGLAAIAGDALYRGLLESVRTHDIALERFHANVRVHLLVTAAGTLADGADTATLAFFCVLARQCFLNEYVYDITAPEREQAEALRGRLAAALQAGGAIPPLWPVAVAAFFPLSSVPGAAGLLDRPWPDAVQRLLAQQIREPMEEARLQETIPHLTAIENSVSRLVQRQYEENAYPRWVRLAPVGRTTPLDDYVVRAFPLAPFTRLGKTTVDILVAGCGTGQHPLDTAQRFAGARVLAVDLSRTSLGHAKRKAIDADIRNVEFAQADILELGPLARRFDLIESIGVLHHLADPWAGWRVLLGLLAPNGVMRIALYSELGRQDVVAARRLIAERGYGPTPEGIRKSRQDLMALDAAMLAKRVTETWDFFSVSECRDLLFHVQEHRLTLPAIKAFLDRNDLRFLGFAAAGELLRRYAASTPEDPAMIDLDRWHAFETRNPASFTGMYQFWVQKSSAGSRC